MTKPKKIVVIGAQTAGLGAASAARKADRSCQVTVLEKSEFASNSPCGLPYFVGGEIGEEKALTHTEPSILRNKIGLDLRMRHEAESIDTLAKRITCHDLEAERWYDLDYDTLVLATGSTAAVPPMAGVDAPNVFTLKNVGDGKRISEYISANSAKTAAVVGAGYIGVEMCVRPSKEEG